METGGLGVTPAKNEQILSMFEIERGYAKSGAPGCVGRQVDQDPPVLGSFVVLYGIERA